MKQYIEVNDLLMWLELQIRNTENPEEHKVLQKVTQKVVTFPKSEVEEVVHAKWIRIQGSNILTNKPQWIHYCSNCRCVGNPIKNYCSTCGAHMTT